MQSNFNPDNDFDFIMTKEAASILHRTTGTLERWRREQKGPKFYKNGRSIYYRTSDIQEFLTLQEKIHHEQSFACIGTHLHS